MKEIVIKSSDFFELLKLKDQSMWDIFTKMIDGEEKNIIFLDDKQKAYFNYILPSTLGKLKEDQKIFSEKMIEKLTKKIDENSL